MKLKYGYIFIPLLAFLAVYYVYDTRLSGPGRPPEMVTLATFDKAEVTAVEMVREDGILRLARAQDGWNIESPTLSPVDEEAYDELIDSVVNMKIGRSLGKLDSSAKGEYGLDNPIYELKLLGEGGRLLHRLALGKENPAGTGRYASTGTGELLLLGPEATSFTEIGFERLRSRAIAYFDTAAIKAFECSTNEVDYAFKFDEGSWFLERPENFKASESWCDGLLSMLLRARAEEFAPGVAPKNLKPLRGGIRLVEEDGSQHVITFLGVDTIKGVLAESDRLPEPYFTEFRLETYLNIPLDELRESHLIPYVQAQVGRVVFREVGGVNLEFELERDAFRITKPSDRFIYEQVDFDKFFDALLGVEATRFVDVYEDLESLGLEPYWIKIELYKADESGKLGFYIGGETSGGYYANIDRAEQVLIIAKEDVDAIVRAANKLRLGVER
jgi:hypothetical protein